MMPETNAEMRMTTWFGLKISKKQLILIESIFLVGFLLLTVILFNYKLKGFSNDPFWNSVLEFHNNFTKYVALACIFLIVSEAQFFLNRYITHQKSIITNQADELTFQKKEITDSIEYARRIQNAMLNMDSYLSDFLKESFVYFKPRDIVSGDFYWMHRKNGHDVIVAADCTGHGVPGAFMSMLGIAFISEIVNTEKQSLVASKILDSLRDNVINSLHQTGKSGTSRDGMDISICIVERATLKLQFAGANNPLLIVRKSGYEPPKDDNVVISDMSESENGSHRMYRVAGDRMPIGIYQRMSPFKNHEIQLFEGDSCYIFTDGYMDQFGGEKGKKFLAANLRKLLLENQTKSFPEQLEVLEYEHIRWKGDRPQVDDMLIIGFKI